jgi:hypothetical protein
MEMWIVSKSRYVTIRQERFESVRVMVGRVCDLDRQVLKSVVQPSVCEACRSISFRS